MLDAARLRQLTPMRVYWIGMFTDGEYTLKMATKAVLLDRYANALPSKRRFRPWGPKLTCIIKVTEKLDA